MEAYRKEEAYENGWNIESYSNSETEYRCGKLKLVVDHDGSWRVYIDCFLFGGRPDDNFPNVVETF